MWRAAELALAALVLVGAAHAKGPARPTPVEVCGSSGCATVFAMGVGYTLTANGLPLRAPAPAPFYAVESVLNRRTTFRAVYVPKARAWRVRVGRLLVWTAVPPQMELAIERAVAGVSPHPAPARWRR